MVLNFPISPKKFPGLQTEFSVAISNFSNTFLNFLGTRIVFIVVAGSKVVTPFYYSGACYRNSYYVCWITDGSWQTNKGTADKTWKPLYNKVFLSSRSCILDSGHRSIHSGSWHHILNRIDNRQPCKLSTTELEWTVGSGGGPQEPSSECKKINFRKETRFV